MRMLFANISSDKIQFILEGEETIVEHTDLEKTIARFLNLNLKTKTSKLNKVFIINWPGSFTNLRIATLAFNMFNDLNGNVYDLYSTDKLTLYKILYKKNVIPRFGYIYIGQRKNWRLADLHTWQYEMIQPAESINLEPQTFFVDHIFDNSQFIDHKAQLLSLSWEDETLVISYYWKESKISLSEIEISPVKSVEANYMMEANVTPLPIHKSQVIKHN